MCFSRLQITSKSWVLLGPHTNADPCVLLGGVNKRHVLSWFYGLFIRTKILKAVGRVNYNIIPWKSKKKKTYASSLYTKECCPIG